ncbi:MAG: glycogen/starch/alpha-glucan phosphorylase [Deltaproteobacteria bacterium]|nr:MAG: glycogen/starch/alpha-glucan phosphorylase [Deltaproteobacteria bacterium]
MTPETLQQRIDAHLHDTLVVRPELASPRERYLALAHTVRDALVDRWHRTQHAYEATDAKQVHYLSAEFLLGRMLTQNLQSLGLLDTARACFAAHGLDLAEIAEHEPDPGLGNGGLGRLAACFLDSMATLGLPGVGQGIRYEFGIFEQRIEEGEQVELGDNWLRFGNVWEVSRPDERVPVRFYGHVEHHTSDGVFRPRWVDARCVWGVPYDMPVAGYGTPHVNTLRLWSAQPTEGFDLAVFNAGDYRRAVEERTMVEAISKVLYPADDTPAGRELRLKQQIFFCTCAIADALRRFDAQHDDLRRLPQKVALQLNDTHPAVAVAELMRVLVDDRQIPWDLAWDLTRGTIAYTNHTLMPEALETWPVSMFRHLLPRHFEIIQEIDRRFLLEVRVRWPREPGRLDRMSLLGNHGEPRVRMAHLATVGSHAVNGVAAMHSELVRANLLRDFAELDPSKFQNKTNGVTPRRWILDANPGLSALLDELIGTGWVTDLDRVADLESHLGDPAVLHRLRQIKHDNKVRLLDALQDRMDLKVNPEALFDIQIKRIHEYKRQLLCALGVIDRYLRLKNGEDLPPRVVLFGGKAAPGYAIAKLHIRFLHDVAAMIARDPQIGDRLTMAFVPNYSVSLAELLIPAANLSEQISMAGKEASGTGNMKFAMNGALTIGTLDGANVEIRERVGAENFFLFGHTIEEVQAIKARGYDPTPAIEASPRLAEVVDLIRTGFFSEGDRSVYAPILHALTVEDRWLVTADFDSYLDANAAVDDAWRDPEAWSHRAGLNIARVAHFSSDRTIRQYAEEIWGITPVEVPAS